LCSCNSQAFPKDLQEYLSSKIGQFPNVKVQSSLYPTYKSVKPIAHATRNFLEWYLPVLLDAIGEGTNNYDLDPRLSTQPPGPVIVLGHSMGGLLAAEAATDSSNNPSSGSPKPKRIMGMVAFDCPYLGMHPHVVVSGIASLFPNDERKKHKTEAELNDHPRVKIVNPGVTDDWESFKQGLDGKPFISVSVPSLKVH
jgi:pimeloyl-ACP methyl ester carboxylesterase